MAALLRSQDALDLETAIREWQSRQNERQHGGPALEPDEKSAVARLTAALDTLFREIVVVLSDKGKFPRDIFISLDRSRSCFSLWSDGHGVASGSLDDKLQRSRKLRQATMKTLSHLSSTLIDRLVPVAHISNPKTKGLCDQVSNILEEINFSHVSDDSSSESTSEYSTADFHELSEDLKTDVDCLIELDQMIRDPAIDPEPETTEADVSLSPWAPHQVFADKIEHRFPSADKQLFVSLGVINYQRYLRCQTERDCNQVHPEQAEQAAEITAGSKFHDSGLGSSLNPASSYAETIMSYRDGNRSIRIPPLPEEAERGEAFPCVACGRSVTITTNSQWKRHLYLDLQPYVCLDASCQHRDSTFSNRANWIQHLALDHGMEPRWEQIKCPLCTVEVGPGKIAITTHLGRHLEEISLSALPAAPDSETNSETSDSDTENIQKGKIWDMSQYLQAVEVASVEEWWGEVRADPAAFSARGDQTPIYSDYLPPPSIRPTAGDEVLIQYLEGALLERQVQGDNAMQQEKRKRTLQPPHDPEYQIHNDKEAAFHRRMGKTWIAQEEQKREIDEGSFEAEETAYGKPEAEQKAEEEERARLYTQAMAAVEEATYKKIKAQRAEEDQLRSEWKANQALRKIEIEDQEKAEAEAKARMLDIEEASLRQMKDMKAAQGEAKREIQYPNKNTLRRNNHKAEFDHAAFASNVGRGIEASNSLSKDPEQPSDTDDYPEMRQNPWRRIEKAGSEALKAARQRLEAERIVEEERARKHAEAMAAAEEKANLSFQAELKGAEPRRQSQAEAHPGGPSPSPVHYNARMAAHFQPARAKSEEGPRTMLEAAAKAAEDQRRAEAEAQAEIQKKYVAELQAAQARQYAEARARAQDEKAARLRFEAELKAAEGRRHAEAEATDKAEAEARIKLDAAFNAANEGQAQEHVKTAVVPNGPRHEISDTNTGVEYDERVDDWEAWRWRWICPSCGSENQDRRKGHVCSNCSYLAGDGDGLATYLPEQLQPQDDEIVTEEEHQKQHQGPPKHQAAFTFLERAPQAEHPYNSKQAEQSVPGSTTSHYRNAPINGAEYVRGFLTRLPHPGPGSNHTEKHDHPGSTPRELDLMEPSVGIDNHTAAVKKKLNPTRLDTAANHPLYGLDSNDPLVLPPIQPSNPKRIHTTIPSLGEDNGLVDGFRDVEKDWSLITDLAEQRRRANRMAQRAYRQKLKRRLEDLERRAGAADGQDSDQSGTSKDGPLNDIPTSPTQRSPGNASDRNRDRDGDREISYGSSHDTHNLPTGPRESAPREHGTQVRQRLPAETSQRADDSDQWQQSDHRPLSTEPPAFQAAPGPRTTSHARQRTPSPPESDGSASRHSPKTDAPFFSVRDDDYHLEDEPWPFPRPL